MWLMTNVAHLMSSMAKKWISRGKAFTPNQRSTGESGLPAILEHLIFERGLAEPDQLENYLQPRLRDLSDPMLIPGMKAAVERVLEAADAKQNVCIYGDYDVDGVSSITLMHHILSAYGLHPKHFIPKRAAEGYGLSQAAIARCLKENGKPDLIITVDCGTVSVAEIGQLREEGVDVVVVDHHEPLPDGLPDCNALVNPKLGESFTYLCAAGVVFKLGHALIKSRPVDLDLKKLLDLVAVATIADIVPMVEENRLLVRHGLKLLPSTPSPGLKALQRVSGMTGLATSMDVGFRIGPRLNAAGRMDQPEDALAILMTESHGQAESLAGLLDDYNRKRQAEEMRIRREAEAMLEANTDWLQKPAIVLGSRDWHPGVVGIVASKFMRQYHKPTFIIAIDDDGLGKGSGRSIEGVSLVESIRDCMADLVAGGGHAMAAGISIREESIDAFRDHLGNHVLHQADEAQRAPKLLYDAEISLDQLSLEFLEDYELLQPFGSGNPQPVFVAREVHTSRAPIYMKNNHLRLALCQDRHERDAVFFGGGEHPLPEPPWDVAFTLDRNTFRGRTSLQLIVQDLRTSLESSDTCD
ncbi:MAG: single-stranded-DNA-specific exonuclease RecJ [Luteolibacter sp.]